MQWAGRYRQQGQGESHSATREHLSDICTLGHSCQTLSLLLHPQSGTSRANRYHRTCHSLCPLCFGRGHPELCNSGRGQNRARPLECQGLRRPGPAHRNWLLWRLCNLWKGQSMLGLLSNSRLQNSNPPLHFPFDVLRTPVRPKAPTLWMKHKTLSPWGELCAVLYRRWGQLSHCVAPTATTPPRVTENIPVGLPQADLDVYLGFIVCLFFWGGGIIMQAHWG